VEAIAKRTNAVIVSNAEIAGYYAAKGFQAQPHESWRKLEFSGK
jgi:hypothetical protein